MRRRTSSHIDYGAVILSECRTLFGGNFQDRIPRGPNVLCCRLDVLASVLAVTSE